MSRVRPALLFSIARAALLQNKGRVLVSTLAIALGVALGYAVHAINAAAMNEFGQAIQVVSGEADLSIRGPRAGFDEKWYAIAAKLREVAVASPMLEADVHVPGHDEPLQLLGIDVFRAVRIAPTLVGEGADRLDTLRPDIVFLSPGAAAWLQATAGDTLHLQVGLTMIAMRVGGVLTGGGPRLAVMDVGAMQWKLQRLGVLTRVDLRLRPGVDIEQFSARLQADLPAGVFVETPRASLDSTLRMSRAYRVNLAVLALVALFTGGLLVFSTEALSVVRRRAELALLRVLGMTRGALLSLLALESLSIGLIGALLGIVVGQVVATVVLRAFGPDLGAGFFAGFRPQLLLQPSAIALYAGSGICASLLGGLLPAIEAARAQPAPALKAGDEQVAYRRLRAPRIAAAFLLLGAAMTTLPPVKGLPLFGYSAILLLMIGAIALIPWLSGLVFGRLQLTRTLVGELAVAQLQGASAHTAFGLAAIVAAVSLMVAMAIMVTSFRGSLQAWLDRILPADLYVRANTVGDSGYLDTEVQRVIAALPGLARVEFLRVQQIVLDPARPRVALMARDLNARGPERVLPVVSSVPGIDSGNRPAVWVSEAIADLFKVRPGDTLRVPLRGSSIELIVAGIWRDYARQNGALVIDRSLYARLTHDQLVTDAALWLAPRVGLNAMAERLRGSVPGGALLEIAAPAEIKARSLSIFDRTFAVTYALEAVAVLIGLFGLSSSVASQVLSRRREFGMLRHIGMTRRRIGAMLSVEGALSAGLGLLIGLALGWCISLVLIHVVNRQSFHWGMDLHVPWLALALFACAMLALATLIAAASGRAAMGAEVVAAVKEDW
jgi:putative ABC transport system permease protein